MNYAHIHLILNHLPLFAGVFGVIILAWGLFRRSDEVQRIGLVLLILNALAEIPVYLTGEPAEEIAEKLPGVSEQIIESHESAAMIALILSLITGVLAVIALASKRLFSGNLALVTVFVALVAGLASGGLMGYTANLGGQVRHSEIRGDQTLTPVTDKRSETRKKDDDDDH